MGWIMNPNGGVVIEETTGQAVSTKKLLDHIHNLEAEVEHEFSETRKWLYKTSKTQEWINSQ